MRLRQLYEVVRAECAKADLEPRPKSRWVFTRSMGSDIHSYVFLNPTSKYGLRISPSVGVRHDLVMDLVSELAGWSKEDKSLTVVMNIGYLMPRNWYKEYSFSGPFLTSLGFVGSIFRFGASNDPAPSDIQRQARRMIKHVLRYGWPFIMANSTLEGVYATMKSKPQTLDDFRFPVICLLLGKKEEARKYVQQAATRDGDRCPHPDYDKFAAALVSKLDEGRCDE